MAKSKLKSALERYQSVDHKAERDKKLRKQAERNKKQKKQKHSEDTPEDEGEEAVEGGVALNGSGERAKAKTTKKPINGVEDEVWETDEEEEEGSEDGEGTAGIAV
ncbi:hypothetical protein M501DRAFT_850495 [Patellaria atrata CBS 101060]|uniref:Uncharacterized protein n=1 Tax=Patellaria atrata CBS 101060 TaxID=1346257 RepID=A0A9P4VQ80_9PEZI|nr:hypothetical protein M501DRAFT_850495 [Patellaria atrata CBS 101060]